MMSVIEIFRQLTRVSGYRQIFTLPYQLFTSFFGQEVLKLRGWIAAHGNGGGARMKTIAVIVLLSCCAFSQDQAAVSATEAGCGPQDTRFEVKSDESQHPAPTAEEGKAVIYFVADAGAWQGPGRITSVFGVDGKWVGAVNSGRYFFVPIEPGQHHLCARRQSLLPPGGPRVSVHSLKAEPGGSYYFRTRMPQIISGVGFAFQLEQMDPDEGRWYVALSKFSASHPKN